MHGEMEVGARARLPDEEAKPKTNKTKRKLQFDKGEMDGVSEEQQAGSSSFSEEHVNAENVDNKTFSEKNVPFRFINKFLIHIIYLLIIILTDVHNFFRR